MRDLHWDETDAMWALCFKTWALWIGCILAGALTGSLWAPLRVVFIVAGFAGIGYFIARMVAFTWRWRSDGKHVTVEH